MLGRNASTNTREARQVDTDSHERRGKRDVRAYALGHPADRCGRSCVRPLHARVIAEPGVTGSDLGPGDAEAERVGSSVAFGRFDDALADPGHEHTAQRRHDPHNVVRADASADHDHADRRAARNSAARARHPADKTARQAEVAMVSATG